MLHIYRQVTGLRRYETFIVAKERTSADRFPFADIEMVPRKPRKNFVRRFWLKHVRHLPPLYYRGEMQGLMRIFRRRRADLMHVYFGHTGVHLLPFIKGWGKPTVVSFHGADVMLREHQPAYEGQLRELLQVTPLLLARSHSLAERLRGARVPAGENPDQSHRHSAGRVSAGRARRAGGRGVAFRAGLPVDPEEGDRHRPARLRRVSPPAIRTRASPWPARGR